MQNTRIFILENNQDILDLISQLDLVVRDLKDKKKLDSKTSKLVSDLYDIEINDFLDDYIAGHREVNKEYEDQIYNDILDVILILKRI